MTKLLIALFLCPTALFASVDASPKACSNVNLNASPKVCTNANLAKNSKASAWMDRNCKLHSREELDAILDRHLQWIEKYRGDIGRLKEGRIFPIPELPEKDRLDPLAADLAGADLTRVSFFGANLTGANLAGADLTGASFFAADLSGAILTCVHLNNANMTSVPLVRANLSNANLTGATLTQANLSGASLEKADLNGTVLDEADLSGAVLSGADLTGATLSGAHLNGAYLNNSDLSGAVLYGADLSKTWLMDANLTEANFTGAKFADTIFEPTTLPMMHTIARAEGLRTLGWNRASFGDCIQSRWLRFFRSKQVSAAQVEGAGDKPDDPCSAGTKAVTSGDPHRMENQYPVVDLVKALHGAGYREAEAEANLAYHRHMQSWWQKALFDWTCEWGANWKRPLWIVGLLGGFFAVLYWLLLRFSRLSRLHCGELRRDRKRLSSRCRRSNLSQLLVVGQRRGKAREGPVGRNFSPHPWFYQPRPRSRYWYVFLPGTLFRSFLARLRWEQPLFWTASLFSVMSVLNLGVQGLDLGRWVRLMQRREFDLKARGTLRLLAGFQSVASFLLLALTAYILLVQPIGE